MSLNFLLYVTLNKRFLRTLMCSRVGNGGANGGPGSRGGGGRGVRADPETWLGLGETTTFTPSHNTHVQLLLPPPHREGSPSPAVTIAQCQSILRSRL